MYINAILNPAYSYDIKYFAHHVYETIVAQFRKICILYNAPCVIIIFFCFSKNMQMSKEKNVTSWKSKFIEERIEWQNSNAENEKRTSATSVSG